MSAPRVAVIAFPGISPFHLSVPSLVLGPETPAGESEPWTIGVCAEQAGPLPTSAGFEIVVPHDLGLLHDVDVVVVPWWGAPHEAAPGPVVSAIRHAHERGATIVGLCLGAFVVADAGVLDARAATTHWKWADVFRARFPGVRLDPAALYIDEGSVLTGAGASAGIDTCLHLLASRSGQHIANRTARRIVAAPHRPGGQAQFIETPIVPEIDDPVGRACSWALDHLDERLTIDVLAAHVHASRSAFTRAFRQRTGSTVTRWVAQQRVVRAREWLETSDASIEEIAGRCGFGNAAVLRDRFHAETGTTPANYRAAFREAA
ncbi:GlxA family transcriptional regulator [Leucobacter japonicus]|uniref:GlxA family transcriptional regulator n=1 Tax=Leucobacter japonicus TaxID=1461259 RepID=UPI0006A78C6B|nr:helix-turn-helix domain-containing protein [Leucobacter japonicus]